MPGTTPPQQNSPNLAEAKVIKINWFKVFFTGVLATLLPILLLSLFFLLSASMILLVAIFFRGLIGIFVLFLLAGTILGGLLLRRQNISSPYLVSLTSISMTSLLYGAFDHYSPNNFYTLASGQEVDGIWHYLQSPILNLLLLLSAGGITFLLNVKIAESEKSYNKILEAVLMFISVLSLIVIIQFSPAKKSNTYFKRVSETEWSLLPTYLPAGVADLSTSSSEGCRNETLYANSYECKYYFKNYPGYLSEDSQKVITDSTNYYKQIGRAVSNDNYAPSPFFTIKVFKDSPELSKYKYSKDQCDIFNLGTIGSSKESVAKAVSEKYPPEMTSCGYKTTHGNNQVYFEKIDTQKYATYSPLDVPINYYFEKNGAVVVINIADSSIYVEKDKISSTYFSDSNFETEFLKFIDSFQ